MWAHEAVAWVGVAMDEASLEDHGVESLAEERVHVGRTQAALLHGVHLSDRSTLLEAHGQHSRRGHVVQDGRCDYATLQCGSAPLRGEEVFAALEVRCFVCKVQLPVTARAGERGG